MIFSDAFEKRFLDFCQKHRLLTEKSILVAFSGGADSTVLLTLLKRYSHRFGYTLSALHVHHGIRDSEADRDASFCQTFCKQLGISFAMEKIDIPALADERGTGLEETARKERYRILNEYANQNGIARIATAHNATDNLETILFHFARGTSVHGVGGIHPLRQNLIRPLLPFSKDEILAYAKGYDIPYVYDSSNDDTDFTRNHIRHRILPQLRLINPNLEAAALRFAESARQDDSMLKQLAEPYVDCNDTRILADLDDAILSRVLLIKYRKIANNEITQKHVLDMIGMIRQGERKQLSLPGKITVMITPQTTTFATESEDAPFTFSEPILLLQEGVCLFANRYRIRVTNDPVDKAIELSLCGIHGDLHVRSRQAGDTFVVGGMTRKIKKMLRDYRIPQEDRVSLPFFYDAEGVVAVLGLPVADRCNPKKHPNTTTLFIEIQDVSKKGQPHGKPKDV